MSNIYFNRVFELLSLFGCYLPTFVSFTVACSAYIMYLLSGRVTAELTRRLPELTRNGEHVFISILNASKLQTVKDNLEYHKARCRALI